MLLAWFSIVGVPQVLHSLASDIVCQICKRHDLFFAFIVFLLVFACDKAMNTLILYVLDYCTARECSNEQLARTHTR